MFWFLRGCLSNCIFCGSYIFSGWSLLLSTNVLNDNYYSRYGGQISAIFSVPIINDSKLEGNEKFILSINTVSLSSRVIVTDHNQSTVVIVDDDGK